jgi:hypothetical protein
MNRHFELDIKTLQKRLKMRIRCNTLKEKRGKKQQEALHRETFRGWLKRLKYSRLCRIWGQIEKEEG